MDRQQRPSGGGQGGSVRAARERMQAGLASGPPPSQIPQPQYGNDSTRAYQPNPQPSKVRQPMPAALSASRDGGQSVGAAISRPTQVPQWPLGGPVVNSSKDQRQQYNQQSDYQPPAGRGQAPQRPPRPRNVPSMLDASKIQDHTPSFQYRAVGPSSQQQILDDDDLLSPDLQSRPSTISSVGTIPDFPLPVPQPAVTGPPRRSANLGPPPSARRGASSYYSNASFVSPIPEESPRTNRSHGSYASSAAMPSRWEETNRDREDSYYEDDVYSDDQFSPGPGSPPASPPEHHEEANLVRSASFGRKGKPTMVTMGKVPEPPKNLNPQTSNKLAKMGVFGPGAAALASAQLRRPPVNVIQPEQRNTVWPTVGDVNSPLASGTGFIDSESSSESIPKVARAITTKDATAVPYAPTALDPRISQILAATAAAAGPGGETPPNQDRSYSRMSAIRRPPKLDIDAVRNAEARGSLTSLPDLIRRATRLAAMMEKGKRPASRLALNDFSDEDVRRDKELTGDEEKRQSGLSGMLAAFPPPGLAGTPTKESPGRPESGWPSPLGADSTVQINGGTEEPKRKRRCCGMPVCVFILILLFTLIVIAAAVVVPLELLVLNKAKTAAPVSSLTACQANTTCANGGTTVVAAGLCSCICSNGFTGATCTQGGNTSCSSLNINSSTSTTASSTTSTFTNVTVGNAIPRLISGAQTNFSIPLASDTIIAKLNAGSLSCNAENALVTFDGSATRVGDGSSSASTTTTSPTSSRSQSSSSVVRRAESAVSIAIPITDITTSNGGATPTIIPATSVSSAESSILTAGPTSSSTSSSATATSSSTVPSNGGATLFQITQEVLDFGRVAVLYILQVRDLETAVTSQSGLQKFFTSVANGGSTAGAANVTVASDATVNFVDKSVTVNGVKVGGQTQSSSRLRIRRPVAAGAWALPASAPVHVHTGWIINAELENKAD